MEHESEILDLILSSAGKAAPYITEKLRSIGNGSILEGIHAIVEFAAKSGIELGEKGGLKKGVILGILGTLAVASGTQIAMGFYQKRTEKSEYGLHQLWTFFDWWRFNTSVGGWRQSLRIYSLPIL